MTKSTENWEERFDEKFTDNGNGWSAVNIYRDGGRNIIQDLKSFIKEVEILAREEEAERVRSEILAKLEQAMSGEIELKKSDFVDLVEYLNEK